MATSIITGLILIFLGLGFLMEKTINFDFNFYLRTYWPSILIIIGLVKLFDKRSSKIGNIILIIIGGLLQADYLDLIEFNIWTIFWPILLIISGLSILISIKSHYKDDDYNYKKKYNSLNLSDEDYIRETTILSGLSTRNQSKNFKGGNATAILGGIDLDLRGATIKEKEAYLELNVLMGGIDILVPTHWRVEMTGIPILGAWENESTFNDSPDAPVLKIRCFVALGGIDVK